VGRTRTLKQRLKSNDCEYLILSYLSPTLNGIHQIFTQRTACLLGLLHDDTGARGSDARAAASVVSLRGVHA
jgi:hypothetical protein